MKTFRVPPLDRSDWAPYALLVALLGLLFLQAPAHGDFYWSDAPRHALNGAFVKDLIGAFPVSDPARFAESYYLQYPALTILFYPPLFYFTLAPAFAIFGVSHETALAVMLAHYIALAFGTYRLLKYWVDREFAFAGAAILVALPELAFWGRQVMLEIPAYAFAVWSAVYFVRYLRDNVARHLYAAAALLVLALYVKLSVAFLALAFAAALLHRRGASVFTGRHIYIVSAIAAVSLLPLVLLTVNFGQANVQSVTGIADAEVPRSSLAGWLWYAGRLPEQMGIPALLLAVAGLGALAVNRGAVRNVGASELLLGGLWFVLGYLFFSSIDLKETRHSVFILLPLVAAAILPWQALLPRTFARLLVVGTAVATFAFTALYRPVFYVRGHAEAADIIAHSAPPNSVVVFSGYRDGSFIFNLRTHEERRDLSVVRADKLLLRIAVRRELGVQEKDLGENEIRDLLGRIGAAYVVAETGFWVDLPAMKRFETVLQSGSFKAVARIKTRANYPASDRELVIFRNLGPLAKGPVRLDLELPIIDRSISGTVGSK